MLARGARRRLTLSLLISLTLAAPALVRAQPAQPALVKDINATSRTVPNASFPGKPVVVGSAAFFVAYSAAAGYELYKTDGFTAGPSPLVDINPGPRSSSPNSLTACGGLLFFFA